jgi:hypothetical protein
MKEQEIQTSVNKIEFLQKYGPGFRRLSLENLMDKEILF